MQYILTSDEYAELRGDYDLECYHINPESDVCDDCPAQDCCNLPKDFSE